MNPIAGTGDNVAKSGGSACDRLTTQRASLEDVYFQLTGGEAEFHAAADVRVGR